MALHLDFEFRMSRVPRDRQPSVRIWVDADHDGRMDHHEEVSDLRREALLWRGRKAINAQTAEGIAFLLRFQAAAGARWRLRVWADQPDRHLVYEEADTATEDAGRVIGWCRA